MKIKMFIENYQIIRKDKPEENFENTAKKLAEKTELPTEKARQFLFCNMLSEFDPDFMDPELKIKNNTMYYKVKIDSEDYEEWLEDAYEEILDFYLKEENEKQENETYSDSDYEMPPNEEYEDEEGEPIPSAIEPNKFDNNDELKNDQKKIAVNKEEVIVDANSDLVGKEYSFFSTEQWIEFKKKHNINVWVPEKLLDEGLKIKFVASEDGF